MGKAIMIRSLLAVGALAGALGVAAPASAAEETPHPPHLSWSFAGPFGMFDRAQLQRGFKVYREACAGCHSLNRVFFRNLSQPGGPEFSPAQVRALAAEYKIQDGPNEAGEMFERPGARRRHVPAAVPERERRRGRQWRQGAAGPLRDGQGAHLRARFPLVRARRAADPLHRHVPGERARLRRRPARRLRRSRRQAFPVPPGGHYNHYYPGHIIAMPKPLNDGQIEYAKGEDGRPVVPETVAQYAKDITAFLMWTAEPTLEQRKQLGFKVIGFLLLLAGLLYFTKKRIWDRVGGDPVGLLPEGEQRH